jgi:hypothetical protein
MAEVIEVTIKADFNKTNSTLTLKELEDSFLGVNNIDIKRNVKFDGNGLTSNDANGADLINDLKGVTVVNKPPSTSNNWFSSFFGSSNNDKPSEEEPLNLPKMPISAAKQQPVSQPTVQRQSGWGRFQNLVTGGPRTMDIPNDAANRANPSTAKQTTDPVASFTPYGKLDFSQFPVKGGGTRRRKYKKQATRRKYKKQSTRRKYKKQATRRK